MQSRGTSSSLKKMFKTTSYEKLQKHRVLLHYSPSDWIRFGFCFLFIVFSGFCEMSSVWIRFFPLIENLSRVLFKFENPLNSHTNFHNLFFFFLLYLNVSQISLCFSSWKLRLFTIFQSKFVYLFNLFLD